MVAVTSVGSPRKAPSAGALRVACAPGEARIAVVGPGGDLLDFALWRPGRPDGVGDRYRGRVAALSPAMGGAFVALGDGPDGFLSERDGAEGLTEGESVFVSVIRAPMGGKGPRLKRFDRDVPSSGPIGLLARGPSPLERLAARWDGPIAVDHPMFAARIPDSLRDRVERVTQAFDDGLLDAVEALESSDVALPGGMTANIAPTPALVAIDMDMAAASATVQPKQTAQFAANRDALPMLFRQIRLRNLSGALLIDPAGLSTRKRQALREPVELMLRDDPLNPRCLGITALGLIEIVRTRIHPPLHESLGSTHGRALRALRDVVATMGEVSADGRARLRPVLRAGLGIVAALESDPVAVADVTAWWGAPLYLKTDPSLPFLSWSVDDGHN